MWKEIIWPALQSAWRWISHADTLQGITQWWLSGGMLQWITGGGIGAILGGIYALLKGQPILLWLPIGVTAAWFILIFVYLWRRGSLFYGLFFVLAASGFGYLYWNQLQIQKDLECYVLPRTLSSKQSKKLTEYLSRYDEHDYAIRVQKDDEEASHFRADLQRALLAAKWHLTGTTYHNNLQAGSIRIKYQQSSEMQQTRQNRRPTDPLYPDEILERALKSIDVAVNSNGAHGQSFTEYSL